MKAICNHCGNLADEKDAIRMTIAEFKAFEFKKAMQYCEQPYGFYSYFPYNMKHHTQICQRCYSREKEPQKKREIEIIEMSHEDRHSLFEFIHKIDPTICMSHMTVQKMFTAIDKIIYELVNDKRVLESEKAII